jgi:hypothetical protein
MVFPHIGACIDELLGLLEHPATDKRGMGLLCDSKFSRG